MWETAATRSFFDDETLQPALAELRPWLITRKYSYERELQHAFPTGIAGPHPALPRPPPQQQRYAEVTVAISAGSSNFAFVQPYRGGVANDDIIKGTVAILGEHVRANRAEYQFLTRERYGGVKLVRRN